MKKQNSAGGLFPSPTRTVCLSGLQLEEFLTSAATWSKLERSWSTSVTVPANHVGSTLTLTPAGITHRAEGALRVTLAFWEMSNTGDILDQQAAVIY